MHSSKLKRYSGGLRQWSVMWSIFGKKSGSVMAKKILVQMRTESMAIESTLDGRMTQRAADDLTVFFQILLGPSE